jgi:hypothetical protein
VPDELVQFRPPINVRTAKIGATVSVDNVHHAADELLKWQRRGPRWKRAIEACMNALKSQIDGAVARRAFEAAAEESGMLLESASASCGKDPRRKLPGVAARASEGK